MLGKLKGYNYGYGRRKTITHNIFVDDFKLYSSTINVAKKTTRSCGKIFKGYLHGFQNP